MLHTKHYSQFYLFLAMTALQRYILLNAYDCVSLAQSVGYTSLRCRLVLWYRNINLFPFLSLIQLGWELGSTNP